MTRRPLPAHIIKHPWFDDAGKPLPTALLGLEMDDQVRTALGWLLFHPEGMIVKRPKDGAPYQVFDGERPLSRDLTEEIMRGLIHLKIIVPSPADPHSAIGNPQFLNQNPEWRRYIPDPKRLRR